MVEESEGGGVAAVTADLVAGVTFSQLLFSEEADADNRDGDGVFNFSTPFYSDEKPPKMLCFGDYNHNNGSNIGGNLVFVKETIQNCGGVITCSTTTDSSSTSSANNNNNNNNSSTNSVPKSNRKRNGCNGNQAVGQSLSSRQRNCKRGRSSENSTTGGHAKVKKERLGERIAALQQLVSPFGKTDTSSVLHEAMGYIKFLQAQVQVLCSPYLHPSNLSEALPLLHDCCEENRKVELKVKDLRSRGLCLVPVECTLQVAESNGADFWSPATTVNNASSDHH